MTCGMLVAWLMTLVKSSWLCSNWVRQIGEVIIMSVMIFAVFMFLRPISQFSYFQFQDFP